MNKLEDTLGAGVQIYCLLMTLLMGTHKQSIITLKISFNMKLAYNG